MSPVPGNVSNLMAEPSPTSIYLAWCPPRYPNGVIIAYEVSYTVNNSSTITNTTRTMLVIVLPLNTYVSDISVRAYTNVGPGNATMHHDVSTLNSCEFMIVPISPDTCTLYIVSPNTSLPEPNCQELLAGTKKADSFTSTSLNESEMSSTGAIVGGVLSLVIAIATVITVASILMVYYLKRY